LTGISHERCSGYNDYGQLGDGSTDQANLPVVVMS
jgi:hypothetical protein